MLTINLSAGLHLSQIIFMKTTDLKQQFDFHAFMNRRGWKGLMYVFLTTLIMMVIFA
jgi:hypothetical protein